MIIEIHVLEKLLEDDSHRDADVDIHRQIVKITKSPIIQRIYRSIEQLSQMSRERTGNIPGVREQAKKDHPEIIQTIISHDPEAAREAMLKHLTFVEIKLKEDISSSNPVSTEED